MYHFLVKKGSSQGQEKFSSYWSIGAIRKYNIFQRRMGILWKLGTFWNDKEESYTKCNYWDLSREEWKRSGINVGRKLSWAVSPKSTSSKPGLNSSWEVYVGCTTGQVTLETEPSTDLSISIPSSLTTGDTIWPPWSASSVWIPSQFLLISVVVSHQNGSQRSLTADNLSHSIQLPCATKSALQKWQCVISEARLQALMRLSPYSLFSCSLWGNPATVPHWEELRPPFNNHHHVDEPFWKRILQPQWSLQTTAALIAPYLQPHERTWDRTTQLSHYGTPDPQTLDNKCFKPLSVEIICCN